MPQKLYKPLEIHLLLAVIEMGLIEMGLKREVAY